MQVAPVARVQVHAKFAIEKPTPLFVVAVEVLHGEVHPDMYVNIPFNGSTALSFRILEAALVPNSVGLALIGLVLAADSSDCALVDAFEPIVGEIWNVTRTGSD